MKALPVASSSSRPYTSLIRMSVKLPLTVEKRDKVSLLGFVLYLTNEDPEPLEQDPGPLSSYFPNSFSRHLGE